MIGGITVLTDLNPWVVSFHLLCSLAIIGLAVLFLHRADHPAGGPVARGPAVVLAWLTFASAWLVLYLGTVVTGSGPHAGDVDVARNGLDPRQVSQLARRRGVPVPRPDRRAVLRRPRDAGRPTRAAADCCSW